MTPELLQEIQEMLDWYRQRKVQQLSLPVDDASKNALGAVVSVGPGSTALTQVYTDSRSDTVTAPKAYAGTEVFSVGGAFREIPYL